MIKPGPEELLIKRLRTRIEALEAALKASVKLQSHYAGLLNAYDGGQRLQFANADAWITRLAALDKDIGK